MNHIHTRQQNQVCIDCGAELCHHFHRSLRGCMLDKGHSGPHCNMSDPDFTWTDEEGRYINTHADWLRHIEDLGSVEVKPIDRRAEGLLERIFEDPELLAEAHAVGKLAGDPPGKDHDGSKEYWAAYNTHWNSTILELINLLHKRGSSVAGPLQTN